MVVKRRNIVLTSRSQPNWLPILPQCRGFYQLHLNIFDHHGFKPMPCDVIVEIMNHACPELVEMQLVVPIAHARQGVTTRES